MEPGSEVPNGAGYAGVVSSAGPPPQAPPPESPPPGRYEAASTGGATVASKFVATVLTLLVIAILVAGGWLIFQQTRTDSIELAETGYEVIDDHTTTMRVDLTRSDPQTPVYCIVRAREGSGAETGRREIYFPPSEHETLRIEVPIRTLTRAVDVDSYGCGEDVPEYLAEH